MTGSMTRRCSFLLLGPLAFALLACSAKEDIASAEVVAAVAVSGGGATVDVVATNSWNTGFNGAVRITNTAFPSPIVSFEIVFRLGGSVTIANSWNGNISAPDGSGNRTATQPDWLPSQPIQKGQIWEVGFTANGVFAGSTIVSVKVNGQTIPIGGTVDPTPPVVSLASSATTVTAAGSITLTATATDNVGVSRVEFRDGTTLLGTDSASPYTQVINLTSANNGSHSYTARAFDSAGNSATSAAVVVTVNIAQVVDTTPPVVSLASSATTVTTASSITLTATATDNVGVSRVEFSEGTTLLGTDTASPYTQVINLTSANNGTHSYTARAFDAAGNSAPSAAVVVTVNISTAPPVGAVFRVNTQGKITKNGQLFPVHCGAWFGLEGRHEPSNDATNPSGAPMELYMGNTFWANGGGGTGRTLQQTMTEIVAMGVNVVRLPVVPQTLNANDPQGRDPNLKNHASVRIANSRLALETFVKLADQNNIEVILDMHSCSNYVGWRKGRLDARPPWTDRDRENYDFKRESFSCAATGNPSTVTTVHPYNETLWLNDLKTLAGLGQQLGVDNIIGIDIYNEPWDYTWAEWKTLTEHAFQAINSVNPNTLLFVQGVSGTAGNQDGTPDTITQVPFGNPALNPNWGENLFEAGSNPPNIPKERLVFSPHIYGPSVFVQKQFMDPAQPQCTGLEGDAAGNARCNVVINPTLLRTGWEEHFGYLRDLGYAVVVGEFGGNLDWPGGQASIRDRNRWGYLAPGTDRQWQEAFVSYMVEQDIDGCYWAINPESGDTAGWYGHAYDPITNTSGWGEWRPFDARKTTLLNSLWAP